MTREEWLIIIKKVITDIDGLEWEAGMNGLTTTIRLNRNEAVSLYELIENSPSIKINKRGQTLCNELQEGTAMKFYKTDSIIETHILNEF